jgi:hypothetical protein
MSPPRGPGGMVRFPVGGLRQKYRTNILIPPKFNALMAQREQWSNPRLQKRGDTRSIRPSTRLQLNLLGVAIGMCNAYNHPFDCGFGGDTGGGGGRGGWRRHLNYVEVLERPISAGWVRDSRGTVESYVNPNAHCPVCGAASRVASASASPRLNCPTHFASDAGRQGASRALARI